MWTNLLKVLGVQVLAPQCRCYSYAAVINGKLGEGPEGKGGGGAGGTDTLRKHSGKTWSCGSSCFPLRTYHLVAFFYCSGFYCMYVPALPLFSFFFFLPCLRENEVGSCNKDTHVLRSMCVVPVPRCFFLGGGRGR